MSKKDRDTFNRDLEFERILSEIEQMRYPGGLTDIDIARYLCGLTSAEENEKFEKVLADNPEFAKEMKVWKTQNAEMFTPERMKAYEEGIAKALGLKSSS